jgi:hypothetical protein
MRAAQQGDVDEVCGGRAYNAQIIIRLHEKSKIRNNAQTPPREKEIMYAFLSALQLYEKLR